MINFYNGNHTGVTLRPPSHIAILLISAPFEQCVLRELSRNLSQRHTGSCEVNTLTSLQKANVRKLFA